MMQMVQQVEQMLQQGAQPEQVMQQLVQSGIPQEQAQQVIQMAMQDLQSQMQQQPQEQPMQQGEQPMQEGQQMPPQQGMMARGGKMYYTGGPDGPPYDLPGMADMSSSEYNSINSYLTNLNTPNFVDNQGNTSSILSRMSDGTKPRVTGWNTPNQSIPGPYNPNRPEPLTSLDRLKQNYFDTSNSYNPNPTLPNNELGSMAPTSSYRPEPMPYDDEIDYTQIPNTTPVKLTGWNAPTPNAKIPGPVNPNTIGPNNITTEEQAVAQGWEPTAPANMMMQVTEGVPAAAAQNTDTPWSEEPWYSKAARYSQAIPGIAAAITGLKNKKRRLTPDKMTAQTVNYEPERIIDREESRRALDAGLRTMRGSAPNAGMLMGNTREAILSSNKGLAGRISESVMREKNTNAQFAQQAAGANFEAGNQFKQLNEQMFQNAQTQALAGLGDTFGDKLPNMAREERKQYLQEWIAKNRLKTRNYNTADSGQDLYSNNTDGYFYDSNGNRVR
jgi:hypothetical protein